MGDAARMSAALKQRGIPQRSEDMPRKCLRARREVGLNLAHANRRMKDAGQANMAIAPARVRDTDPEA